MRRLHVVAFGLALAGCAAGNVGGGGGGGQMTWMRADGKPVDGGFQAAANQCRDAAARAASAAPQQQRDAAMMDVMEGCMQRRGYVWQCDSPLGALGQGGCAEGDTPAGKGPKPARSGPPGRSTT